MDVAGEGAAREQPPTRALVWTVGCGCSAYHDMPPQGYRRFGVVASAVLGDGWMVEAGGLRTSRLLAVDVGPHKCRLQS
jgi:hypothetical protein